MSDNKISGLNAVTTLVDADLVPVVDDPGGSAETKKITFTNFTSSLAPEGKCIDIVQVSNQDIVDSATDAFVFDFVPSKIVLDYSGVANKLTDGQWAHTTGRCVIIITGTDTFTSNLNYTVFRGSEATFDATNTQNATTYVAEVAGGFGSGAASFVRGTGAWVTSTKTLTVTWQETLTTTANTFFECVATAYK